RSPAMWLRRSRRCSSSSNAVFQLGLNLCCQAASVADIFWISAYKRILLASHPCLSPDSLLAPLVELVTRKSWRSNCFFACVAASIAESRLARLFNSCHSQALQSSLRKSSALSGLATSSKFAVVLADSRRLHPTLVIP